MLDSTFIQCIQILLITCRITTILILNLSHNDTTSIRNQMRLKNGKKNIKPIQSRLQILRIFCTKLNSIFLQQPVRKSSKLPLSTNIRSGTNNCQQVVFLCKTEETVNIICSLKIIRSSLWFMHIPSDIRFYCVDSSIRQFLEGIFPSSWMDTEIMESSRNQLDWLSIQKIGVLAHREVSSKRYG